MDKLFISIIIPCYNEEKNLNKGTLSEIDKYLKKSDLKWEVIISDDGSKDTSREIVTNEIKGITNFRLLENAHGGKPSAIWNGIKSAKGDYVLFTDMDQSTPIVELDKLIPFIDKKVGAVIGSRGLLRKNFPLYRRLGSIIFMAVRKLFILPEIEDTQCGFKLFRRNIVYKAFPKLQVFRNKKVAKGWSVTSYDVELLHIIKKMGYEIIEVPVEWEDQDVSVSKGGTIGRYAKESREMLLQILQVKINDLRGSYKSK